MWTWWWIIWKSSNFCGSPPVSKFLALRRLPKRLKTLELRSGDTHKNSNVPQMLLLLRKPSDQKYFYWWTVRLHLNFYVHKNLKMLCTFCLAKISLWSVWRDLREAKCVDLVVNYMKSSFLWISTSFKVFKALRRLPKRLKTLELRSGDTHKNSNVPQMLLAFEETVWSKNIFIDERFDYIWIFMSTKIWRFFMHILLS